MPEGLFFSMSVVESANLARWKAFGFGLCVCRRLRTLSQCNAVVHILFASRSNFQERNSSRSTIVALLPKARMCIFGCFYLTVFFKLLVFYRIARARTIFRIQNSLLMTAVLTMEGI